MIRNRHSRQRGSTIVEFALVVFLLLLLTFAGIEFDRMVLVYTTVAHATRTGVRYAIVHGSDRTGIGDPASGPGLLFVTVPLTFAASSLPSFSRESRDSARR